MTNNVDRLYNISNLLSFLLMGIMLVDAMQLFEQLSWFDVDWAFGICALLLCVVVFQAKRLDLKRNNPNMIVPISKYAYFGSFIAFFVGYLALDEHSTAQIIAYSIALTLDAFSSISSMAVVAKMKKKIT